MTVRRGGHDAPAMLLWVILGIAWVVTALVTLGLCRAAAASDDVLRVRSAHWGHLDR